MIGCIVYLCVCVWIVNKTLAGLIRYNLSSVPDGAETSGDEKSFKLMLFRKSSNLLSFSFNFNLPHHLPIHHLPFKISYYNSISDVTTYQKHTVCCYSINHYHSQLFTKHFWSIHAQFFDCDWLMRVYFLVIVCFIHFNLFYYYYFFLYI